MNARNAVKLLLTLALGLPLLQALFSWVGGLLAAMEDQTAAAALGHCSTAVGVVWLISLVGLLIALAFRSLE